MRNKIILLFILIAVLVTVCLYPSDTSTNLNTTQNDTVLPVEAINDHTKSVIKIVHYMEGNNQSISKTASAVILHEDDNYYYAVTNYHVLIKEGFETTSIDAVDYLGNTYQGTRILLNQAQEIISLAYDLGLIKFEKGNTDFIIPDVRVNTLTPTTLLTAVGYPNGIREITTGYFTSQISLDKFAFQVIAHNVPIVNGYSGGALFDSNGKIVGINVSAVIDINDLNIQSHAIPMAKVYEYLSLFNI